MNPKKEFFEIFSTHIHRPGADKLLEYLFSKNSDFFVAPASTKYHGDYDMGLVTQCKCILLSEGLFFKTKISFRV